MERNFVDAELKSERVWEKPLDVLSLIRIEGVKERKNAAFQSDNTDEEKFSVNQFDKFFPLASFTTLKPVERETTEKG